MPIQVNNINHGETTAGKGLRTVVYMQGCPLRCLYCHNPENQSKEGGYTLSFRGLVSQIRPYRKYFDISGGGVTFSGGEPLLQNRELLSVVKSLTSEGYRVTIDTSGCMPLTRHIREILLMSQEVLLDIKYGDPKGYSILTEGKLQNTLDTAHFLETYNVDYRIRYVVVPGLTDRFEAIKDFGNAVADFTAPIELLGYHTMAISKYEEMMKPYYLTYAKATSAHLAKVKVKLCSMITNQISTNL